MLPHARGYGVAQGVGDWLRSKAATSRLPCHMPAVPVHDCTLMQCSLIDIFRGQFHLAGRAVSAASKQPYHVGALNATPPASTKPRGFLMDTLTSWLPAPAVT